MKNKKWSTGLIALGLLLVAAALCLTIYNRLEERRAGNEAAQVLEELEEQMPRAETTPVPEDPKSEETLPDYILDPEMEMPVQSVYNISYIGTIEIPVLDRKLPVISEWNYSNLRIAPCRYEGSVYQNNLIIAAHNYNTHFGTIKNLSPGDAVIFTDAAGNVFQYQVVEIETLGKNSVEEMSAGDWDLTLFTCTIGGATRVTVRCERTAEETEGILSSEE